MPHDLKGTRCFIDLDRLAQTTRVENFLKGFIEGYIKKEDLDLLFGCMRCLNAGVLHIYIFTGTKLWNWMEQSEDKSVR